MKWYRPSPKRDDTRLVRRLALFPKRLSDGYVVWLEKYESRERYEGGPHSGFYWYVMQTNIIGGDFAFTRPLSVAEAKKYREEIYGEFADSDETGVSER